MKIRTGFVSNSSSSSFILKKDKLSAIQADKIYNHIEASKQFNEFEYSDYDDSWSITESEDELELSTWIDNFDMYSFLVLIGVKESDIISNDY